MKKILRWVLCSTLALCLTTCHSVANFKADSARPTLPLFILAGQSNMQGQAGDAAAYPEDLNQLDPIIPFYWVIPGTALRSQYWTSLGPQEQLFPAGHFGPEISFARALTQAAGDSVAILKFSLGGTGLSMDWKRPGEGGLYDQLGLEYNQAISLLRENETVPEPRALIWIQGESDAETPELASQYQERLQLLIDDFRNNYVENPQLPVILGLDEQHPWVLDNPRVIAAQEAIAAADPHIIRTSMVGLEKADTTHLTPAGLVEHGDRLAAAYLTLKADESQ